MSYRINLEMEGKFLIVTESGDRFTDIAKTQSLEVNSTLLKWRFKFDRYGNPVNGDAVSLYCLPDCISLEILKDFIQQWNRNQQ